MDSWLNRAKDALAAAQNEVENRFAKTKKPPPVVHSGNRNPTAATKPSSSSSSSSTTTAAVVRSNLPRLKELPHLRTAWSVDEAVMEDSSKIVVIRYGRIRDPLCIRQDKILLDIYHDIKGIASIFAVDLDEVPEFTKSYELCDPSTLMMYYQRKHVIMDVGAGRSNKINWVIDDAEELRQVIEEIWKQASQGESIVTVLLDPK